MLCGGKRTPIGKRNSTYEEEGERGPEKERIFS